MEPDTSPTNTDDSHLIIQETNSRCKTIVKFMKISIKVDLEVPQFLYLHLKP